MFCVSVWLRIIAAVIAVHGIMNGRQSASGEIRIHYPELYHRNQSMSVEKYDGKMNTNTTPKQEKTGEVIVPETHHQLDVNSTAEVSYHISQNAVKQMAKTFALDKHFQIDGSSSSPQMSYQTSNKSTVLESFVSEIDGNSTPEMNQRKSRVSEHVEKLLTPEVRYQTSHRGLNEQMDETTPEVDYGMEGNLTLEEGDHSNQSVAPQRMGKNLIPETHHQINMTTPEMTDKSQINVTEQVEENLTPAVNSQTSLSTATGQMCGNSDLEVYYEMEGNCTPEVRYQTSQRIETKHFSVAPEKSDQGGLSTELRQGSEKLLPETHSQMDENPASMNQMGETPEPETSNEMNGSSTPEVSYHVIQSTTPNLDHGTVNHNIKLEFDGYSNVNSMSRLNYGMGQTTTPNNAKNNDKFTSKMNNQISNHVTLVQNYETNDNLKPEVDETGGNTTLEQNHEMSENTATIQDHEKQNNDLKSELDHRADERTTTREINTQADESSLPELNYQSQEMSIFKQILETYLYAEDTYRTYTDDNLPPEPDDEIEEIQNWDSDEEPTHQDTGSQKERNPQRTGPSHEDITGGRRNQISEFPFIAILRVYRDDSLRRGPVYCTSSILTADWVLTAAHCIGKLKDPRRVEIIAGQTNIRYPDQRKTTQERRAGRLVLHKNFFRSSSPGNGDLALVQVAEPFHLDGKYVSSIKLRGEEWFQPTRKTNCTSVGWGRVHFNDRSMGPLQSVSSVATHGANHCPCVSSSKKLRVVCLEKSSGSGICKGDSGGPLVCDGELVGVAHVLYPTPFLCISALAGRPECGMEGWIDIYMYTCPYLDWIRDYVGEAVPPQPQSCSAARPNRGKAVGVIGAALGTLLHAFLA